MEIDTVILFVGIIVGACIMGGTVHSGLAKIAGAIGKSQNASTSV